MRRCRVSDDTPEPLETFLSDPAEYHAVIHGFWNGFYDEVEEPEYEDSRLQPHYWRGGYLAGSFTAWVKEIYES